MKRSELTPGLEVERKQGRDYPNFMTGIIVLDVEMWDSTDRWRRRDGGPLFEKAEKSGPGYNCRRGIPCAVRHIDGTWKPEVFRTQELVPAGSKAAHDVAKQAERERREATDVERTRRLEELKERSGIERLRYATGWRDVDYHSVTLSIEDFERLLSDAEESRARRDTV